MITSQNAAELRARAARCAGIAASPNPEDAAMLISVARESLARADAIDGRSKANGHDLNALIESGPAGNKPMGPSRTERGSL